MKKAWERGYDGSGVVVTVLDDGLDHKHPDLRDNYVSHRNSTLKDYFVVLFLEFFYST